MGNPDSNAMPMTKEELKQRFWQVVLAAAGPVPIKHGCEHHLGSMIDAGLESMFQEGRTGDQDILKADASLKGFIDLMKQQALLLGHPGWLGEDTFEGAGREADRLGFEFFPFWPPFWRRGATGMTSHA
jgi:hypothetical protein